MNPHPEVPRLRGLEGHASVKHWSFGFPSATYGLPRIIITRFATSTTTTSRSVVRARTLPESVICLMAAGSIPSDTTTSGTNSTLRFWAFQIMPAIHATNSKAV